MKILPVGKFKTEFSEVLAQIQKGKSVGVSFGKKKKPVAVLVPYDDKKVGPPIKLGLLEGKGKVIFKKDFKMTEEELIGL